MNEHDDDCPDESEWVKHNIADLRLPFNLNFRTIQILVLARIILILKKPVYQVKKVLDRLPPFRNWALKWMPIWGSECCKQAKQRALHQAYSPSLSLNLQWNVRAGV